MAPAAIKISIHKIQFLHVSTCSITFLYTATENNVSTRPLTNSGLPRTAFVQLLYRGYAPYGIT